MHARDARAAGLLKWSVVGWLALVAVWLTWTPFELVGTPNTLRLVPDTTVTDVAGNLLLLVPFGAVVVLCGGRQPVLRATILAAMLSASLELGQIWIFGRVASVWDVALNTTGAVIAAHLTLLLASRTRPPRVVAAIAAAVFVVIVACVVYASRVYTHGMRLAGWDARFRIAAGDEVGGARRYVGEISRARICAGGGRERLCAGPDAPPATRASLAMLAETSQIVEIEANVRSGSSIQSGPTRIVTFSGGPFDRNITLGQERESLVLRLRTPMNGANGDSNEIVSHDVLPLAVPITIHVRYDHATVTTRLEGAQRTRVMEHILDGLAAPLLVRGRGPVTAVQSSRARGLTMIVLAIPLLLVGAWTIREFRRAIPARAQPTQRRP